MLGLTGDQPYRIAPFMLNNQMNLIEPYQMNDKEFDVFTSCLREVLLVMKVAKDRKAL